LHRKCGGRYKSPTRTHSISGGVFGSRRQRTWAFFPHLATESTGSNPGLLSARLLLVDPFLYLPILPDRSLDIELTRAGTPSRKTFWCWRLYDAASRGNPARRNLQAPRSVNLREHQACQSIVPMMDIRARELRHRSSCQRRSRVAPTDARQVLPRDAATLGESCLDTRKGHHCLTPNRLPTSLPWWHKGAFVTCPPLMADRAPAPRSLSPHEMSQKSTESVVAIHRWLQPADFERRVRKHLAGTAGCSPAVSRSARSGTGLSRGVNNLGTSSPLEWRGDRGGSGFFSTLASRPLVLASVTTADWC